MSSTMRVLLILLVAAGVTPRDVAGEIFGETKDNYFWSQTLVIPADRISLPEMEKAARAFLGSAASHRLAVLSVYNTREIAAKETGAPCHSYKQWKVDYNHFPRGQLVAADVIALNGDAVLRLRSADGSFSKRILSGRDPTQFSVEGTPFEILIVGGRRMTRFEVCATPGAIEPRLYVRTEAKLTQVLCEQATGSLAKTLRTKYVRVEFRNDHWFPCSFFPVVYPFFPPEPPPSESAYRNSVTFTCSITCEGQAHCMQTTGPPLAPAKR